MDTTYCNFVQTEPKLDPGPETPTPLQSLSIRTTNCFGPCRVQPTSGTWFWFFFFLFLYSFSGSTGTRCLEVTSTMRNRVWFFRSTRVVWMVLICFYCFNLSFRIRTFVASMRNGGNPNQLISLNRVILQSKTHHYMSGFGSKFWFCSIRAGLDFLPVASRSALPPENSKY